MGDGVSVGVASDDGVVLLAGGVSVLAEGMLVLVGVALMIWERWERVELEGESTCEKV